MGVTTFLAYDLHGVGGGRVGLMNHDEWHNLNTKAKSYQCLDNKG